MQSVKNKGYWYPVENRWFRHFENSKNGAISKRQ